jgi:hypothetical protein
MQRTLPRLETFYRPESVILFFQRMCRIEDCDERDGRLSFVWIEAL